MARSIFRSANVNIAVPYSADVQGIATAAGTQCEVDAAKLRINSHLPSASPIMRRYLHNSLITAHSLGDEFRTVNNNACIIADMTRYIVLCRKTSLIQNVNVRKSTSIIVKSCTTGCVEDMCKRKSMAVMSLFEKIEIFADCSELFARIVFNN